MTTEKIISIPLAPSRLLDSPTNPRTRFNDKTLAELAESIKSQGVMQPVVVRPGPKKDTYELVFGHRRTRAARLAGLEFIPGIVRELSDEQAAVAQIHENLEREDVSPLEEAEGFQRLLREFNVPVRQVLADCGKSKSYVYGRLKLLNLCDEVRAAMDDGLPTDVALKIARLPTAGIQAKALKDVQQTEWRNGEHVPVGWMSMRDGLETLDDTEYFIPIASAKFDPDDATLHPDGRTCGACRFNSRNDEGASDAFSEDTCTDVPCFALRTEAARQKLVELHRTAGTLIEGEAAKLAASSLFRPYWLDGDGVMRLSDPIAEDRMQTVRAVIDRVVAEGGQAPALHLLHREHQTELVLLRQELPALWAAAGLPNPWEAAKAKADTKAADTASQGAASGDDDADADDQPALNLPYTPEEAAAYDNWRAIERAILKAAAARPRTTEDLRYIVAYEAACTSAVPDAAVAALGLTSDMERASNEDDVDADQWLLAKLPELGPDQLGVLLLGYAIEYYLSTGGNRRTISERVAMARRFGINPLNPDAPPSEASPTPSTAARAQGGVARDVRYRNAATGETWSGRGQQPRWLKAALEAGAKLTDFDVQTQIQAGFAGSDEEGAGSAGESSSTTPADAGGEPAE